ncbi:MAG TPA: hypothetical protein ENJ51_08365, partial [Leucothrix mucor]|nr:hypothetical protein [Leucothrix mucor]
MHNDYSIRPHSDHHNYTYSAHQNGSSNSYQSNNQAFQGNAGFSSQGDVLKQLLSLIAQLIQTLGGSLQNTTNNDSGNSQTANNDNDHMMHTECVNSVATPISSKEVFNTPVGASKAGAAMPGDRYETTFTAHPGEKLSFATMLVQSNDLFFAPDEAGISLFDHYGKPVEGDVTDKIKIWDAGTEQNEMAGEGANQAPRQTAANTGAADSDNRVRVIDPSSAGYPEVNEQIKANIEYLGNNEFKLTITNLSGSSALAGPIAPGVAVVHTDPAPIFSNRQADRGLGLEALAEDGDPTALLAS